MADEPMLDEQGVAARPAVTVFVSDPTADAEQVAQALRGKGFGVVDVPLLMLVARAAVQRPSVVLVDADSQGALEVVARMRELPEGEGIHVLFVASSGGVISSREEALAHEASGFFSRPVDLAALVREVEALTLGASPPSAESSLGGDASRPLFDVPQGRKAPSTPPTLSPEGGRGGLGRGQLGSVPASSIESLALPSQPPTSVAWVAASRAIGLAPPVSTDLQRLLAEAEERAHFASQDSVAPSPEQEVEAVLPEELLAALDEPLAEDERDVEAVVPSRPPSRSPRERTSDGGASRTTGASGTGSGATPHGTGSRATGPGDPADAQAAPAQDVAPVSAPQVARPPEAEIEGISGATSFGPGRASRAIEPAFAVGLWGTMRVVADAIASRASGSLSFVSEGAERRVVLREGDVVTCASTAEEESLLAFLSVRGDLPRETVRRLGSRFPAYGKHAGAALVARGYLRQAQMWATLRAHAEWLLGRILRLGQAGARLEAIPPGRLANEPSVFGGATGAEVFTEVVRRVVSPAEAIDHLGGPQSRLGLGSEIHLLEECSLPGNEPELIRRAAGRTLREVLDESSDNDFAATVLAATQLGIVEVLRTLGREPEEDDEAAAAGAAALDSDAIRESVRARLQLAEEGDYFAVLGVHRDATSYELRRAFLELRRAFDASRLLSPEVADLADDVKTISYVLEEAYEVLRDPARRERYRRAIEGPPEA